MRWDRSDSRCHFEDVGSLQFHRTALAANGIVSEGRRRIAIEREGHGGRLTGRTGTSGAGGVKHLVASQHDGNGWSASRPKPTPLGLSANSAPFPQPATLDGPKCRS